MGPLVFTGLATLGGAIAIALVASSTSRTAVIPVDPRAASGRRVAIIAMAFCEGIAVLGTVAGILTVTSGVTEPADRVVLVGLAVVGAAIGLAILAKHAADADRTVSVQGAVFIGGCVMLAIVTALLATVLTPKSSTSVDGPFAILGLVAALAAVAQGLVAGRAVRSIDAVADPNKPAVMARWVPMAGLIEGVGVLAFAATILLIVAS